MFQQFEKKALEVGARKRTLVSVGTAVAVYCGIGGVLLYAATGERPAPKEREVEVSFAPKPAAVAEKPAPPPPPPPPPVAAKKAARPTTERVRKRDALVAPKEIPKEAPPEADPSLLASASLGAEDLEERGTTEAPMEAPPPPAPEPPPAPVVAPKRPAPPPIPAPPPAEEKVATPIYLPERARPPRPLPENPEPRFPPARLRAGATDTVALKVVVTEGGALEHVKVLRGQPDFVAAVMDVLPRWRFTPAEFEGEKLRVFKILEINFRIRD